MSELAREDLLEVRARVAAGGHEMTPAELEELLRQVDEGLVVVDEPGRVSYIRELRRLRSGRHDG